MNDLYAAAHDYARAERQVFLLGEGKRPFGNCAHCRDKHLTPEDREACTCLYCHGFYAATPDPARLDRMFAGLDDVSRETSMLAMRTGAASDVVVVDIDLRKTTEALQWMLNTFPCLPVLDHAPRVITASGGFHLWLAHPGERVPNSSGKLAPGVDVRGDNGYVILPPSRREDGAVYEWCPGDFLPEPPQMGPVLLEMLCQPPEPRSARPRAERGSEGSLSGLLGFLGRSVNGERNTVLHWCACRASEDLDDADTEEAAHSLHEVAQQIGLDARSSWATIRSGFQTNGRYL